MMVQYHHPPLSVLVVEDHDDHAQSTAELLALHGYTVRVANCGEDALLTVAIDLPDVVLLDIGLPDISGWEVAARLRSQTVGRQPLIVAISGYGSPADMWRSADAGIDLHLLKPVDPCALAGLLTQVHHTLRAHAAPANLVRSL